MAENKLKQYRAKRDFNVTKEPKGNIKRQTKDSLKFSIQRHAARADHYDLRLEYGGVALSWAVPKGPSFCTQDKRLAMRVEDHPIDYMDFEGIIPKGEYGGGTVMLWDEGEWIPRFSPEKGLKDGSLKFFLNGRRLKGNWALVRMEKKDEKSEPWLLIKERDQFAKPTAGISRFSRGVRSGKSMTEIAGEGLKNPFDTTQVMLAELCGELPDEKGWIYELKYDGHRTLGFVEDGKAILRTRNGYDCTASFPAAAKALETLLGNRAAIFDGEMTVPGKDGIPDFGALQAHLKSPGSEGLCYILFDLLALDGEDLRSKPLVRRKAKLKALLEKKAHSQILSYSTHTEKMTKRQQDAIKNRGLEGIVAKRKESPYSPGRNGDWVKLKFRNLREFVIGGYSLSEAGAMRALLVGYYEGKNLHFCGKVGTGFTESAKKDLAEELSKIKSERSFFENVPKSYSKDVVWVKPKLLAQVEYAEMTASHLLRQASFKGLRRDKSPLSVDAERTKSTPVQKTKRNLNKTEKVKESQICGVLITHPEKVMFPGVHVTKAELAKYYEKAAPRMLPYLKERLLSLVCCPSGIEGEKFFRKHLEGNFRGIGFTSAGEGEGENFFVKSETGIISLVQYNAVEFHVSGRKKGAEKPDTMVFDLDPDEGLPLSKVRRGVRDLKKTLDELGLVSFLKTSGGKGYHIVVPFQSGTSEEQFGEFSRQVALLMEKTYPDRFTSNMSKKQRTGKIFLDWQRNRPKATSAAPYSVRARENAPISMPIEWDELGKISPSAVTLRAAIKRLDAADPWAEYFTVKKKQRLKAAKEPLNDN